MKKAAAKFTPEMARFLKMKMAEEKMEEREDRMEKRMMRETNMKMLDERIRKATGGK